MKWGGGATKLISAVSEVSIWVNRTPEGGCAYIVECNTGICGGAQ